MEDLPGFRSRLKSHQRLLKLNQFLRFAIVNKTPPLEWPGLLDNELRIGTQLGAMLTLAFSYLFLVKDFWFHGLLISMLAAVIGLLIFLIAVLDHPYWGEVSVTPAAYQLVLDKVMHP